MTDMVEITPKNFPQGALYARMLTAAAAEVSKENPTEFRLYFKEWQRYRGLTTKEASRQTGIAESTYFKWCAGSHVPNAYYLPRLAMAFRCSVEELYFPPPGMKA